ncbi:hypothetical protein G7046_g10141 [Stylonectria norvegica]|nr:hypothetical protein G7046_g10141 [Stylonectria norvegica]
MDNQQNLQKHRQRREAERERKRALRACDGCRRQKEKCDGGVPCRRCTRLHRQCEFLGPTARDGDAATDGSNRNRSGVSNADLTQRIAYMEKIITHYAGNIPLDSESLRILAESVEKNPDAPRSHRQVAVVASPASDYLGVDDENFTVQPLDNNTTHYSGEFSHWNFSMRIKQWIEQCVPEPGRLDAPGTLSFKEYYRAEELQSTSNTLTSLAALPPRYVAEFLIQAFYKHAETNYFYLDRGWLTEQIDNIYSNPAGLNRREVGTVCMIWIILAIGTQYAYLDSRPMRGDHAKSIAEPSPFSEDAIGVMFYQQACKLVPDVLTVASLESVQAILLIGIYTLPLDASGLSYIYLNLAVKLAIQNGMHRRYPAEGLDPFVRETRNRVWWTAYTTEKRVGIYHGRPTSISSKDVDAEMPVDRPDLMPSSNPANIAHMLATLRLNQALAKIAHEMSVLKTAPKQEVSEGLNRVIEVKEELRKWYESLPETVFRKEVNLQSPIARPDMHLKLEYCLVRMYAGRPFIFPRDAIRGTASTSSSPADSNQRPATPHKLNPRSILVADCVEAAITIVETSRAAPPCSSSSRSVCRRKPTGSAMLYEAAWP